MNALVLLAYNKTKKNNKKKQYCITVSPENTHEQSKLRNRIRYGPSLFKLDSVFHMSECDNARAQFISLYSYCIVMFQKPRKDSDLLLSQNAQVKVVI